MTVRSTAVEVRAGCLTCHPGEAVWTSANAMLVAARHAKATGHPTWCEQLLRVAFGAPTGDGRQADLFPASDIEDAHVA